MALHARKANTCHVLLHAGRYRPPGSLKWAVIAPTTSQSLNQLVIDSKMIVELIRFFPPRL